MKKLIKKIRYELGKAIFYLVADYVMVEIMKALPIKRTVKHKKK